MKNKIQFKNVTYRKIIPGHELGNPGEMTILDDVSFNVEEGEIFAVMGPSGSGKSTLLRLINRLEDPSEGEIILDGKSNSEFPVRDLRRKAGLVLQIPQVFEGTVMDNLLYGPRLFEGDLKAAEKEAMELLPGFNLPNDILQRDPIRLSVGEKQRISLLRTLLNKPEIILLDEPTSSLDPQSSTRLLELIRDINRQNNTTIIIVTHIPEHARRIAARAMILVKGKIQEQGEIEAVFENPQSPATSDFISGKMDGVDQTG